VQNILAANKPFMKNMPQQKNASVSCGNATKNYFPCYYRHDPIARNRVPEYIQTQYGKFGILQRAKYYSAFAQYHRPGICHRATGGERSRGDDL
jgi:hypothetical protein